MNRYNLTPAECEEIDWDAVVIGTGMGGAIVGYELARLGRRVLFIERGPFLHAEYEAAPAGISRAVARSPRKYDEVNSADSRSNSERTGRWPERLIARTNFGTFDFHPPNGCISGGSTAFYAAALERFSPVDFTPRRNFPNVHDSTLPERWPVSYEELEPYYEKAEQLFGVRGTQDPLFPGGPSRLLEPPKLNPRDQHILESFESLGLHPYRVHTGCEFMPGCDGCTNGPCRRSCKRDAAWTCLMPALMNHDAIILADCEVVALDATASKVNAVICVHEGTELHIKGKVIVLAAGALASPSILLRSKSKDWPRGIGNGSDLVGRNLMFHGGDFIAVNPLSPFDGQGVQKTLALNNFYFSDGEKLGTFQTLGIRLELGRIMQYLRDTAEASSGWQKLLLSSRRPWLRKLSSPFVRIGAMVYFHFMHFKDAAVWVSIIEELPYWENRLYVNPDNGREIVMEYKHSDELRHRVASFRRKLQKALGPHRLMVLSPKNKIDYAHICGTCRFGDDPSNSVLDRNNRIHGVANLYVVDASCFPSSAGTNPSLTIAANALRVATEIDKATRLQ